MSKCWRGWPGATAGCPGGEVHPGGGAVRHCRQARSLDHQDGALALWPGDGIRCDFTLGFNLSAQTLSDPQLWEFVDPLSNRPGHRFPASASRLPKLPPSPISTPAEQFVGEAESGVAVSASTISAPG